MTAGEKLHKLIEELPDHDRVIALAFVEFLAEQRQQHATSQVSAVEEPAVVYGKQFPSIEARNQAVIQLLDQWDEEDPEEQRSTWEALKRSLDEDRLSERKFFTRE